ncbi:MAG: penicillin-binding protein 2 [Pseudomonadota bacterium]|nr:MAG: cell division protein FtsI [Rhodobacterales bacterium 32-66-9]
MRTPLRPLARILQARQEGLNPDMIERENLKLRHDVQREKARGRAQYRLVILCASFVMVFGAIGARMGLMAATEPVEPRTSAPGAEIIAQRADITDRNGRILATNMLTYALYAQPKLMVDPKGSARKLGEIFPELDAAALERRFTDGRSFVWVRKVLSPEQMQQVYDIGDPGLLFGPREMRLYPNGTLAAHVLGGASFGAEGVQSAEVIGTAGIEKALDARLRDPAQGNKPVTLSIDLTLQSTVEEVLAAGVGMLNARGAAAILMNARTGEVLALASLPTFDPNDRSSARTDKTAEPGDSPLFNRAVQGVYELGSTFKIFTVAQAMELGLVTPETMVDANAPLKWGRFKINEFDNKNYGPLLSVSDVIAKSSNVATANIALMIGGLRQQAFLKSLGFFEKTPVELVEASGSRPIIPQKWSDIVTITVGYGQGFASSPMNLATGYAAVANGGVLIKPTLLKREGPTTGVRVMSEKTARDSVKMLRRVVTEGTASLGDVPGYEVAGKTGTAEKPKKTGGYYKDRNINTFGAVFPASNPQYVLVVMMDEAVDTTLSEARRTAGWTAVPVAAEIIRRVAPLMGLRPTLEPPATDALTAASN